MCAGASDEEVDLKLIDAGGLRVIDPAVGDARAEASSLERQPQLMPKSHACWGAS